MRQPSTDQILAIEERLRQAMLTSHVAELDELIAPELIFTNYSGQLVTKQQDLAIHQSGILKFSALTPSEQQIQCHDGYAIVSVRMDILGHYDGQAIEQAYRFTRIWGVSSRGTLQVVAGHIGMITI